jgi:hypothetical protein
MLDLFRPKVAKNTGSTNEAVSDMMICFFFFSFGMRGVDDLFWLKTIVAQFSVSQYHGCWMSCEFMLLILGYKEREVKRSRWGG